MVSLTASASVAHAQASGDLRIVFIDKAALIHPTSGSPALVAAHKKLVDAIERERLELKQKVDALAKEIRGDRLHPKYPAFSENFSLLFKMEDDPNGYLRSRWAPILATLNRNIERHLGDYMRYRKIDRVVDISPALYRKLLVIGEGSVTADFLEYLKRWEACPAPCSSAAASVKPLARAPRLAAFSLGVAANNKTGIKPMIDGYKDFNSRSSAAFSAVEAVEKKIKQVEDKMAAGDRTPAMDRELAGLKKEYGEKLAIMQNISAEWLPKVDALILQIAEQAAAIAKDKGIDVVITPSSFKGDVAYVASIAQKIDLTADVIARFNAAPAPVSTDYTLGVEHYRDGQNTEAISAFTKAIATNSKRPEYFTARAKVYIKLRNLPAALRDLDRAIALGGVHEAYTLRANIHIENGRYENAAADLQFALHALKGSSDDTEVLGTEAALIGVYSLQGKPDTFKSSKDEETVTYFYYNAVYQAALDDKESGNLGLALAKFSAAAKTFPLF